MIHKESEGVFVEDISRKTGVFVNGVRATRKKLNIGDARSVIPALLDQHCAK